MFPRILSLAAVLAVLPLLSASAALDAPDDVVLNRRCRSTIAHECGHGLLHTVLYVELWQEKHRRNELASDRLVHHQDRAETIEGYPRPTEWWEYQANQVMACLLLPKRLVCLCAEAAGPLDPESLARHVSDTFDVSRQMARIRLQKLGLGENLRSRPR